MLRRTLSFNYEDSFILRNLVSGLSGIAEKKITLIPALFLCSVIGLGLIGPYIAPYGYQETIIRNGEIIKTAQPSLAHPLGTTVLANDVLSRVIIGARPTVIAGLLGGGLAIAIGMTIGITAGYVGGRVDSVLMRFTDFAYSMPFIPFALVLSAIFGIGFYTSVLIIGIVLWRGNARVLRSQVLQIKNRQFVKTARATGASTPHIIVRHILPNVAPMAFLFFAIAIGLSIILQASLAFLGASNPFLPSWGVMLRNAYDSGFMARQLGWSLTPGLLIACTVVSTFLIGRELESEGSEEAVAQG